MRETSPAHTVPGLAGHWHRSLTLPCGYQHFNWYDLGATNSNGVTLCNPTTRGQINDLRETLEGTADDVYLYTHHEVFLDEGVIKHTRSSPNWDGGLVTYATCKHYMRSAGRSWVGCWLAGLAPKGCAGNTLMFIGRVQQEFNTNYELSRHVRQTSPQAYRAKLACGNPRGDLYTPRRTLRPEERLDHLNYVAPQNHTRSTEFYKASPGSVSDRPDGKVPKWWRDVEYVAGSLRRPRCFTLGPVWLFCRPTLWTSYAPGRAVLRLHPGAFAASLGVRAA